MKSYCSRWRITEERQGKGLPRTTEGQLRVEVMRVLPCQLVSLSHFLQRAQRPGYRNPEVKVGSFQEDVKVLGEKGRA